LKFGRIRQLKRNMLVPHTTPQPPLAGGQDKKHFSTLALPPLLALFLLTAIHCGTNDVTTPEEIIFPDTNVSFARHVQPFLTLSCNNAGCHDAARSDNGDVALTSWVNVRNIKVVNQPGDTNCGLVRVLYGKQIHSGTFLASE